MPKHPPTSIIPAAPQPLPGAPPPAPAADKTFLREPSPMDARLKALVAKYEGADDICQFTVNVDVLEGTRRCTCCMFSETDPPGHAVMSAMLAHKEKVHDVAAYLQSRGHRVSISMLSRHQTEHLRPALHELAVKVGVLERLAKTSFIIPSGDMALMTVKALMIPLMDGLEALDHKEYRKLAKDDPLGYANMCLAHAKALSAVQQSVNRTEVMQAKLQLDKLRTKEGYERAFAIAQREMTERLMETPEGRQLLPVLQRLLNPQPEGNG
jgi:hypothetical protein